MPIISETFEERVAALGGAIELLVIRAGLAPADLWEAVPGWSLLDEEVSGSGLIVAAEPDYTEDGFTPNVTAMLWRITAKVPDASALVDGVGTRLIPDGFDLVSRQAGPIPVAYTGAGRWFRDEFRMTGTGRAVDSYARLDVQPCSSAPGVFHALQRTHTVPEGSSVLVPATKAVDLSSWCTQA
ncbi:hypothetical protein [Tsukamurella pseudospumae]|uniref:Uncharacterized protein n=1 Tax=Tsukamurella pseudospumae TaxID=239498 RepID=A0A137Z805_9ACTN|nr:hypothetical protein [Tsukamurella pseudospumae]KXO94317.1 hypothetical protein AXK61_23870 [Tsukamurella pseudospumae]